MKSSPKQMNKGDRPTVNKNGHREKVNVGVCNLGSSTEMNGCKEDKPYVSTTVRRTHLYTYVYPCIKASHRRVGTCPCCDKSEQTHMSNNFSTSSGVTSLCTKISGGLVLSINDLRKPRFVDGPGIKKFSLAIPYRRLISPLSCGRTSTQTRKSINAPRHCRPHSPFPCASCLRPHPGYPLMRWQGWRVARWGPHRLEMDRYLTPRGC